MKLKQLAAIYRDAARNIANGKGDFSCLAAQRSGKLEGWTVRQLYTNVMLDGDADCKAASRIGPLYDEESRNHRVLLLLLMAEWVLTDYRGYD